MTLFLPPASYNTVMGAVSYWGGDGRTTGTAVGELTNESIHSFRLLEECSKVQPYSLPTQQQARHQPMLIKDLLRPA